MTRETSPSLGALRLRLTAWSAGTLLIIFFLLGIGLFTAIADRFEREMDDSLVKAAKEAIRVARARDHAPQRGDSTALIDPINDIRIPDRELYLLDTLGHAVLGPAPGPWIQELARDAWHRDTVTRARQLPGEIILRARGEAARLPSGRPIVAVAVANELELEDHYTALIAAFGVAALAAIVLVTAGGWLLAMKSTAPVESAFAHMRRFMADAAHELRTPLSIVRGRAEVALQRPRDGEAYTEILRAIEQDSARLGRIVEDLLMLARADAGERRLDRQRVFLDDIAMDAASAAQVMADRKSIRIAFDEVEETPIVGDPVLLRQLVIILLDNAVKFTHPGGEVRISVGVQRDVAILTVADTGIGIPAEQLPYVFERFYRADASRTRSTDAAHGMSEGAGLGLSIAQWIADEHEAGIFIDSTVNEGTRVTVQFPIMPAAAPESSPSLSRS